MNKLEYINKMDFKVTWKLIEIGLNGLEEIQPILTWDEVFEYLDNTLINETKETNNTIMIICQKNNYVETKKILHIFSNQDKSDVSIQKRKWRAFLLKKLLNSISKDSLQGLLELMEFWISMKRPNDCPFVFPKGNSSFIRQNYFTTATYNEQIKRNKIWLTEEIRKIIADEADLSSLNG